MKKIFNLIIVVLLSMPTFAQVGIGTDNPDPSAALDVTATDKGFLMPRMTTVQKEAIVAPALGLQVYDADTKSTWTFNGTAWKEGVGGAGKFVDGANSDIAYYGGKVGIGRNSFGNVHKLWVQGDKDTDGTNTPVKILGNYNGTGTSTATYGLAVESNNTSSGTITSASGYLSRVFNGSAGTIDTAISSWSYIENKGLMNYGLGAYGVIYNHAGNIALGIGNLGSVENSSGAQVDTAILGDFSVTNDGIMTNLYGSYFEYYGSSSVTNSYAIYVDGTFNKGTDTNYAIYSAPDIDSYFNGNVGFGTDAPQQKVHVSGVLRLEPQSSPPAGALGDLYAGTDGKLHFHDGTGWKTVNLKGN